MQQAAQLTEFLRETLGVVAVAFVAMIVECRSDFSGRVDARTDLLGKLKAACVAKCLGFADQLLADFKMPGRNIVDQHCTEVPAFVLVGEGRLGIT
ncbi:hypothetical protein D3C77_720520 [compost metagenome]